MSARARFGASRLDTARDGTAAETYRHLFYNRRWQLTETRSTGTANTHPDTLDPEQAGWMFAVTCATLKTAGGTRRACR